MPAAAPSSWCRKRDIDVSVARAPNDANLFDSNAKYADVVNLPEVLRSVEHLPAVA